MKRSLSLLLLSVLLLLSLIGPTARVEAVTRPTLYWGSRGQSVRLVQWKLNSWGYYKGKVDGVYGKSTYSAVVGFQRKNGLKADGVVGPRTWAALGLPSTPRPTAARTTAQKTSTGGLSRSNDAYLLAQAVSAEAKGEPYEGQVAVAAVILNRIKSSKFPNTLRGVIFEPLAFESVDHGTIYYAPTASARRAAQDALNGWDPTYGCIYFWNPAKVSGTSWVWTRKILRRIGDHVFAR